MDRSRLSWGYWSCARNNIAGSEDFGDLESSYGNDTRLGVDLAILIERGNVGIEKFLSA